MKFQRVDLDIANLSDTALKSALMNLDESRELHFYDPDYPSVSDPGAYVKIRNENGRYLLYRGNHGWSSGWQPETAVSILTYMLQCKENSRNRLHDD